MKMVRYERGGIVHVVEVDAPTLPSGGLVVQTEACGLCSGELMAWYMESKAEGHVLGHEVSGRVIESDHPEFPVGCRVAPHHHAPCGNCEFCAREAFVHCPTWKTTKLIPGGMAEQFAVPAENLRDTHRCDDLLARDAALAEPVACVVKSIRRAALVPGHRIAIIGAGALGLVHGLILKNHSPTLIETRPERRDYAENLGLMALAPNQANLGTFDRVFVLPGNPEAVTFAQQLAAPEGAIILFAPLDPGTQLPASLGNIGYFRDLSLISSFSCGPNDTAEAMRILRAGVVRAEHLVSDFVGLDDLPSAYGRMRAGEILKAMVVF